MPTPDFPLLLTFNSLSFQVKNPNVLNTVALPGFQIFTSLVWVPRSLSPLLPFPFSQVCLPFHTASGVSGPLLVGLLHSRACFSCDWQIRTWLCPCCVVPPQAVFLPWNPLSLSLTSPQVFIDFQKSWGGRELDQVDVSMQTQTWLMSCLSSHLMKSVPLCVLEWH